MKKLLIVTAVLLLLPSPAHADWAFSASNPQINSKDFAMKGPTDTDDTLIFKARTGMVITDIHCIVDPADAAESISINVMECDCYGDNCVTVDAAITCDNDGAEDDGALTNGTIDLGDWVQLLVGAPTGTVSSLTGSIYYRETVP